MTERPDHSELRVELERFKRELQAGGLRESTVHSYLMGSTLGRQPFVALPLDRSASKLASSSRSSEVSDGGGASSSSSSSVLR